jgi:cytochrome P450
MSRSESSSPPARGPLGHQPQYAADPLGTFRRWSAMYGRAVRLRFGPTRALLVTSPAAVEDVLVTHADAFRKAPLVRRLSRRVIGESIVSSEGSAWARQRSLLAPAFARPRMKARVPAIALEVRDMRDRWIEQGRIPVLAETMRLSQRIAARVLFGVDVSDDDVETVAQALEVTSADFQHGVDHPLSLAVPDWLPTPRRRRLRRAVASLDDVVGRMISARRRDRREGTDVLGHLMRAQPTTPWLTDRLIRDEVVTFLVESREDPALLLTWSLGLLGQDRNGLADRAAAEVRAVIGDSDPAVADLGRLPFIVAVLNEALRLYPLVYGTGREAIRDCMVDGVEVNSGTLVLLGYDAMNHDPDRYTEPEVFRPERWLDPGDGHPVGAFTPFGLGPRRCLGEPMAWTVGIVGLAVLARDLAFSLDEPELPAPAIRLSLRPSREIWLSVHARA